MDSPLRFEFKYSIDKIKYLSIKNSIAGFVSYDPYSIKKPGQSNQYTVRSLYFDTSNYKSYVEKIDGESDRFKIRARTYATNLSEAQKIKIEFKIRRGTLIQKYVESISKQDWIFFEKNQHFPDQPSSPILNEFLREYKILCMGPKAIVEYEREAFFVKNNPEIRITFDHNVRFAKAKSLFQERLFLRKKMPQNIVLEIKCRNSNFPLWLSKILAQQDIKQVQNSKYAQAIECSQSDISWL